MALSWIKKWSVSFWKWFSPGWKCGPKLNFEDIGIEGVCRKEWNDPIEDEESNGKKHS